MTPERRFFVLGQRQDFPGEPSATTLLGNEPTVAVCPKCGRRMKLFQCGHCGSRLSEEQTALLSAVLKKLAKTGGDSPVLHRKGETTSDEPGDGNGQDDDLSANVLAIPSSATGRAATKDDNLQNTETPPSLCRWIFERLDDAGIRPHTILDPCAGRGNLTRPFRPQSRTIEYEIRHGLDFFKAPKVTCDLVICNAPWSEAERWLRQIVEVVGNQTPLVFICPTLLLYGDKKGRFRRYLESAEAPALSHTTILPRDTFVRVYCPGIILWFNLPHVKNVALVPSSHLIRRNDIDVEDHSREKFVP
jgi:hypothetical protein